MTARAGVTDVTSSAHSSHEASTPPTQAARSSPQSGEQPVPLRGSLAGVAGARATTGADRLAASHETLGATERLSDAAKFGDLVAARAALNQGADPSALDKDCATPLHWAAGMEYPAMIYLLVSHGADINAPSCQGATKDYPALVYATVMGKTASVEALLELGADKELPAERSALLAAAGFGHAKIVEVLLIAGANPLALLDGGGLPHAVAFLGGHFDLAAKLLRTEIIAAVMRLRDAMDAARARGPLWSPAAHKLAALLDAQAQPDRADWEKTREYVIIMQTSLKAVQPDELTAVGEEWDAADTVRALLLVRKPYHCDFIIRHYFWPVLVRLVMLVICWKLLRRYRVLQRLRHLVYHVINGMFSITAAVFRLSPSLLALAWRTLKHITRRRRPPALPARRSTHPPRLQRQRQNANADAASPNAAPRREPARINRRPAETQTSSLAAAPAVQPRAVVPASVMQRDPEPAPPPVAAEPSAALAEQAAPEARTATDAPPLAPVTPVLPQSPPSPPPPPLAEDEECVVCMDAPREATFTPCRHRVACIGCANKLRRSGASCPVCRADITRVIVAKTEH